MIKKGEEVKEIYDIEITKETGTTCCSFYDGCENITRFSDRADDFVVNYNTTYSINFKMDSIVLCEDCLKRLKIKIDECLK